MFSGIHHLIKVGVRHCDHDPLDLTPIWAQILEDADGKRYTAPFPEGVNRPVQYGVNLKAHSVYLSQYQLIPYNRIEETFRDQAGIPVSGGSIYNFNEEAYEKLEAFDAIARSKLINSDVCHADETGINIDGKRRWLHCVSNDDWPISFLMKKEELMPPGMPDSALFEVDFQLEVPFNELRYRSAAYTPSSTARLFQDDQPIEPTLKSLKQGHLLEIDNDLCRKVHPAVGPLQLKAKLMFVYIL